MAARVTDTQQDQGGVPDRLEVHLVPMRRRHLRSVLQIEAQVYPRPWSLPLFMSELNLRNSRPTSSPGSAARSSATAG